jgi:maltose alpha-D-glucosyltransferase/alpha-amylase
MSTPLWFQDAIIYQLHVKTFQDSNGDGIGDFGGLIQRIDYLAELGVTALWLMPFYPSPLRDDGYDIADYVAVNPSYGTLEQFEDFLAAAHGRGLKVITELVLNHTSDQHPWFQRARRAPPDSPERNYYVWSDTADRYREARVIFQEFEPSNWTWDHVAKAYFWHRFYAHQPDLNFDNPQVHEELFRVIDFWLERGVDGVRLDAVPYLYEREGTNCENLPETHAFLRKVRAYIDSNYSDRMLLAEANQWPEDAAAYFGNGDECHMNFHFPLMPRLFMALQMEDRFPIIDILEQTPALPPNCQWAIFLRNHDELTLEMVTDEERDYMVRVYANDPRARINLGIRRRLAPLLGNNRRKIELINSLLLSLPGTPIIYYGDEIGMGDNIFLGDRNGVRTPMQWSPDRNGGFSSANPQRLLLPLIIDPEYHYETINAENQQRNLSSLFWWMRRTLAVRKSSPALARGRIEFLQPENAKVLAYLLHSESEVVLVVANLSRFVQMVALELGAHAGAIPKEMYGSTHFPAIRTDTPMVVTLGPHGFYWFTLRTSESEVEEIPIVPAFNGWTSELKLALTRHVLPSYLPRCSWFQPAAREVREYRLAYLAEFRPRAWLVLVEVAFQDGQMETYLLTIAQIDSTAEAALATEAPEAMIARIAGGGALVDAFYLPEVRECWLRLHQESSPVLRTSARHFVQIDNETLERVAGASRNPQSDRSNTTIPFGDTLLLKVYRRFGNGAQPEVESLDVLQRRGFPLAPPIYSALSLDAGGGRSEVASLSAYIANQGDGWGFALDAFSRYFDRALESRLDPTSNDVTAIVGGVLPERVREVGRSIAALHCEFANESDPAFGPEPFSAPYQRSLYQSLRGHAGRILRLLRKELHRLSEADQALATRVIEERPAMLNLFGCLLHQRFAAARIRVHGDLHLAQLVNTGKEFVFVGFAGDNGDTLREKAHRRCALVDVASMLRSIDYAANTALHRAAKHDRETLRPWAALWVRHMSDTLTSEYFAAAGTTFLPPGTADCKTLLNVFLLDRTLHELGEELARQSGLFSIALAGIADLLASHDSPQTAIDETSEEVA